MLFKIILMLEWNVQSYLVQCMLESFLRLETYLDARVDLIWYISHSLDMS